MHSSEHLFQLQSRLAMRVETTWTLLSEELRKLSLDYCLNFNSAMLLISGSVTLKKVKFNTKLEHEFINNFKVVQSAFSKIGIDKVS